MKKILVLIILITLAAALGWALFTKIAQGPTSHTADEVPYIVPSLTQEYKNDTHKFSLSLPADFTARTLPAGEGDTIVFEGAHGNGVQIIIVPFDEDLKVLTKERIEQEIPNLKISDEQPVEIGANHQGLAFKSDNPDFDCAPSEPCAKGGGASREVWFVFRGYLYQISTYERLDPLLKAIFATWKFV